MANWQGVQQGLVSGFQVGQASAGAGRMGSLGARIKEIADRLKSTRETGEEMGRKVNLLGVEGLIKGQLLEKEAALSPKEWKPKTQEEALEFERAKVGLKPKLTLAGALGIISDPMKASQTKKSYPNLYAEAEAIVKEQLGEDILNKVSPTNKPKTPGKLPTKIPIVSAEDIMDTNW